MKVICLTGPLVEASAIGPAHDGLRAGSGHALLLAGHETGTTQMIPGIGTQHLRLALGIPH
jgi:hypothetical protein